MPMITRMHRIIASFDNCTSLRVRGWRDWEATRSIKIMEIISPVIMYTKDGYHDMIW